MQYKNIDTFAMTHPMSVILIKLTFVLFWCSLVFVACDRSTEKDVQTVDNNAYLLLYRKIETRGTWPVPFVHCDGKEIGPIHRGILLKLEVSPGVHTLRIVGPRNEKSITVEVNAGRSEYIGVRQGYCANPLKMGCVKVTRPWFDATARNETMIHKLVLVRLGN